MTNNFEKDINVPSKNNKYRLGRTKIERQQIFEDIKEMIENGFSLQNIADKYGVTRQAISLKMINCGFNVSQEVKRIKREKIKKLLEETSVNNVEKLNRKVKYYKTYNIRLRNDLTALKEKLSRKDQECERLKDIIETKLEDANICDSALNYINDEYLYVKRQLGHLKEQLEAYKMEAEEGKEINAELKADNALLQMQIEEHHKDMFNKPPTERSYCKGCTLPYTDKSYKQAIEKIKEIAKFYKKEGRYTTGVVMDKILQICDEVNDV